MKSIKKKALEDLEKFMPILSEEEQCDIVGGTNYYRFSGSDCIYLGFKFDGCSDALITNAENLASAERYNSSSVSGLNISPTQMLSMIQCRVQSGADVRLSATMSNDYFAQYVPSADGGTGGIIFNQSILESMLNNGANFYDITSTLNHELAHQSANKFITDLFKEQGIPVEDFINCPTNSNEFKAYKNMCEVIAYNAETNSHDAYFRSSYEYSHMSINKTSSQINVNNYMTSTQYSAEFREKMMYIWNRIQSENTLQKAQNYINSMRLS